MLVDADVDVELELLDKASVEVLSSVVVELLHKNYNKTFEAVVKRNATLKI